MSNARVRMLRAAMAEQAERTRILEARLRRGESGAALVLSVEDMGLVLQWYSWAEDEGCNSAYSAEGVALAKRIQETLDKFESDAVE